MSKIRTDQIKMKIKMSNVLYKRIRALITSAVGREKSFRQVDSEALFSSPNTSRIFVIAKDGSFQVRCSHCYFIFHLEY